MAIEFHNLGYPAQICNRDHKGQEPWRTVPEEIKDIPNEMVMTPEEKAELASLRAARKLSQKGELVQLFARNQQIYDAEWVKDAIEKARKYHKTHEPKLNNIPDEEVIINWIPDSKSCRGKVRSNKGGTLALKNVQYSVK